MAGIDVGRTSLKNIVGCEAPSIWADSISDLGS